MADNGNVTLDGLYELAKSLPSKRAQAKAYLLSLIGTISSAAVAAWADITGKPATFPPDTHAHVSADITDGLTAAQVIDLTDGGATTLHSHAGALYTDEEAQDAVGTILTDTATIDFTYTDATPAIEASVKAASITEAMQVLADNTTNNVSTTKHGYVPKAPNTTTTFLRGDATWATPVSDTGFTFVLKTSDETITSDNTLSDDTHLKFNVSNGKKYYVEVFLDGVTAATPDFKCGINVANGTSYFKIIWSGLMAAATSYTASQSSTNGASLAFTTATATAAIGILMLCSFTASADGTCAVQWAQNTSNGANTTVYAGSVLKYKQLN